MRKSGVVCGVPAVGVPRARTRPLGLWNGGGGGGATLKYVIRDPIRIHLYSARACDTGNLFLPQNMTRISCNAHTRESL